MKIKTTLATLAILFAVITVVSALSSSELENELSKLSSNEKSIDISQFITAKPEQIEIPQQTKQRAINEVLQKLEQNEKVDVLIWLNKDVKAGKFAKRLNDFEVKYVYDELSGLSGTTTSKRTISELLSNKRVDYISLDGIIKASLSQSRPLIQANIVESNYSLRGEGIGVCHLDTGINYNHPNLAHAYVGGYDFINNDPDPLDDHGHGTATAGVIVSNHSTRRGISPEADLVAVKVINATGYGLFSDLAAGINWCIANRNTYNIQVASMSLGSLTTYTPPTNPGYIEPALQALYNSNIPPVASSGNDGSTTSIGYPAVSPYAISVGATYDANVGGRGYSVCTDPITYADMMTCYSNRASFLDLVAPGSDIVTTSISGGITGGSGTSMATPHITGTIALMKQRANQMTVPQIENVLKTTGVPIYDNATGLTFKRVNAWDAVNAVPFISKTGVLQSNGVITLNISDPMNPGAMYLTLLSLGTSPGVPLPNGLTIPLVPDFLFSFSLGPSQIMVGNIGLLDNNGRATTTIFIPNFPGIQSFTIYSGFISVRPDLSEFLSVSNAVQL